MYFAAHNRLVTSSITNYKPTYKCGYNTTGGYTTYSTQEDWNIKENGLYLDANMADKFSVSTSKGGNGMLKYPVALMTADEIVFIGGKSGSRAWYYYNSENNSVVGTRKWWTMTPLRFTAGYAINFFVYSSGLIGWDSVDQSTTGIRPVLSLKSCVKYVSGNGSSATPYEVSVDSTCASKEN